MDQWNNNKKQFIYNSTEVTVLILPRTWVYSCIIIIPISEDLLSVRSVEQLINLVKIHNDDPQPLCWVGKHTYPALLHIVCFGFRKNLFNFLQYFINSILVISYGGVTVHYNLSIGFTFQAHRDSF